MNQLIHKSIKFVLMKTLEEIAQPFPDSLKRLPGDRSQLDTERRPNNSANRMTCPHNKVQFEEVTN